jgi:predicted metal-dependent hydrolase
LRLTRREGLVLVAPPGFDPSTAGDVLARRSDWIARTLASMQARYPDFDPWNPPCIPDHLDLRCLGQSWTLRTIPGSPGHPARLRENAGNRLLLRLPPPGGQGEYDAYENDARLKETRDLLLRFLVRKARPALPDLLADCARETGLSFSLCQIRTQSSRWGSCSARGTISLNAKLLFLPRHLVRYICIHELCHTRHMNHSRAFHDLVRSLLPQAQALEKELDAAEARVPRLLC